MIRKRRPVPPGMGGEDAIIHYGPYRPLPPGVTPLRGAAASAPFDWGAVPVVPWPGSPERLAVLGERYARSGAGDPGDLRTGALSDLVR